MIDWLIDWLIDWSIDWITKISVWKKVNKDSTAHKLHMSSNLLFRQNVVCRFCNMISTVEYSSSPHSFPCLPSPFLHVHIFITLLCHHKHHTAFLTIFSDNNTRYNFWVYTFRYVRLSLNPGNGQLKPIIKSFAFKPLNCF